VKGALSVYYLAKVLRLLYEQLRFRPVEDELLPRVA
jgi:hypothetical protein